LVDYLAVLKVELRDLKMAEYLDSWWAKMMVLPRDLQMELWRVEL